ncbi:hypothetical protein SAMN05428642_10130 [Flaviramulus basaltis]|uniref:Uncharacterized protein n=1 Tax=Flaviramulus basaltis TaxID=369401 RepID=A0A1K2IAD6_9FLAO|nr:hypothetical protein [Flaviramulus basaltis]SFZ89198.1 hypothetical protein SAMN05428642_10130 [Flaviramulus basaltis]
MKNLKFLTTLLFISILSLTSCQDEIDNENGQNPNTNSAQSPTANNLERSSMYDGSFDDFLDGASCSSILFPVTATINNTDVTLISQADYALVLSILGEFTNDDDNIQFQFPLSVKLSNYTEVEVANQTEYDALINACSQAENTGEDAINCLNIDFPITILTYSLNFEQTGSVVIESEQQLYAYMNSFGNDELFAVNYPITANLNGQSNTVIEITSDMDLQAHITDCLANDDAMDEAEENAQNLENILVEGAFKVESFINTGVNTANDYADYTIDFANDLSCLAQNTVNTTINDVEGTYEVASELEVYLTLTFSGNATFELLNNTWEVTSYSNSSISLQSTTNAAITLVLTQI